MGIQVDVKAGKISIPQDKLMDIKSCCNLWAKRGVASKRALQSLCGRLLYLHRCVAPARLFVNRILSTLRSIGDRKSIRLDRGFHRI